MLSGKIKEGNLYSFIFSDSIFGNVTERVFRYVILLLVLLTYLLACFLAHSSLR